MNGKPKSPFISFIILVSVIMCADSGAWEPNYGTQLTFSDGWKHHVGEWSPDGKWITTEIVKFDVNQTSIMLFPLDGSEPVNLLTGNTDGIPLFPKFTSDSKKVYFTNYSSSSERYIGSIDIETRKRAVVLKNAGHGYWSHNGRYLVHIKLEDPQKVAVYDKDTGSIWNLAEETSNTWVHSCFSPDDSYVVTTLGGPGERYLYKIPTKGGKPEQLTFEKGEDWYPRFTPDGKWILYKHFLLTQFKNNNLMEERVFNTETSQIKCLFPALPRVSLSDVGAVLSPDGSKVCYPRFSYTSRNQLFIADFHPERTWEPHFKVIPYDTQSAALIIIPLENAPTINRKPLGIGDEIAVFTPLDVCAGMGVWTGETLAFDAWGDDYDKEGILGFKYGEHYTFKIWDISEQKELFAKATYLEDTVEGLKTPDVYVNGSYCKLGSLFAVSEPASIEDVKTPETFVLSRNYPNPFNLSTTIRFFLSGAGSPDLGVYDITGRKVRTLVSGFLPAGTHEVGWDGRDDSGRPVSSGVYLSRLNAGNKTAMGRMLLLK